MGHLAQHGNRAQSKHEESVEPSELGLVIKQLQEWQEGAAP
jgi:hypothetical protein